jgi:hypothetical protein
MRDDGVAFEGDAAERGHIIDNLCYVQNGFTVHDAVTAFAEPTEFHNIFPSFVFISPS